MPAVQTLPNPFQQNPAIYGPPGTDVPVQQAFEASGFANGADPNIDFLGQIGGAFDGIHWPEGLLDFGAWSAFFANDPTQPTGMPENGSQPPLPPQ